jgi:hypothetical protein
MRILTENNDTFSMNAIPDSVEDMRYCVLDYSDHNNVDYMFIPLLWLESFNEPAVDLRIGNMQMQMPMSWSIVIGDKNSGELELISLKQINDREFQAFTMNPLSGYMPEFLDIEIINVFPDVKWHFPKLKYGHILTIPLELGGKPKCAYFVKDTNKLPDVLDITQVV